VAEAIFPTAEELVQSYAITLVQGTHVTPQPAERGDEWIDTWSEVRVLRRYVDVSPRADAEPCDRMSPPRGIRLSQSTSAVTLPGGTVFYRGVRVTAIGPGLWFAFEPDARYLLFTGAPCHGRLVLSTPEVTVLRVSGDGRLAPVTYRPGGLPFTNIASIDSLETLESRLRAAGRAMLRETDR
jgi:hypothetical protein